MRRISLVLLVCTLICIGAYRWGDIKWESAKQKGMEHLYLEVSQLLRPYIYNDGMSVSELVYADMEHFFAPLISEFRTNQYVKIVIEDEKEVLEDVLINENEREQDVQVQQEDVPQPEVTEQEMSVVVSGVQTTEKKVNINRGKLQEFDYLRQNFYQVDNTTTVDSGLLDVNNLLGKDMTLKENVSGPQILIYHTHSQEAYKDSVPGDLSTTIVGVGDYLEKLLEENYGIEVLHHKGVYDLPSRDNAYSVALPNIEKILEENPTIEIVIDLHRDGVAEDRHLVTEVNGKQTAKLMFFNGLSKTTAQGELTYLPNPYIAENLALSFQLQLTAEEYYPGLMRKIYLKGYRYNLHFKPKSMLVEVGAQTNTVEEAKNAMEPLADILGKVLYNGIYK